MELNVWSIQAYNHALPWKPRFLHFGAVILLLSARYAERPGSFRLVAWFCSCSFSGEAPYDFTLC